MRTRVVVVTAVALIGLLGGCSSDANQSPTETAAVQTPAASQTASSAPTPAAPSTSPSTSTSPSPSTSSKSPTSDGHKVTTADGALSWTMSCKPKKEDISGNEEDKKTYRSSLGWSCGKRGAATSGVFVLELIKKPANADAARRQMRTALEQLAPNSKPKDDDLAGTPGISGASERNGKKFGYQVISFGNYLAVFIALPPKDLRALTDTVEVS